MHVRFTPSAALAMLKLLAVAGAKPSSEGFAMTQITVTLPEDVVERARRIADRSGRPVEDLLAETIELSLRPLARLVTATAQ